MKKKLLITLGCSYTEGVGCYDETLFTTSTVESRQKELSISEKYEMHRKSFHANGWPVQLASKMGYDRLINMGLAGSGTSGQLKRFYESHYYRESFDEYDTTIMWLLSEPSRFGMYSEGVVRDILPKYTHNDDWFGATLQKGYVEFVKYMDNDPILDQIFYIKTLEHYCENMGFNLLLSHSNFELDGLLKYNYKSKYYITPYPTSIMETGYINPICLHPTKEGYGMFVDNIYNSITKYHSYVLQEPPLDENKLEWEWFGAGMCHIAPREDVKEKIRNQQL